MVLSDASDLPVCIVGAGPSGLSAAHSLEAIGRRTIIFEKQSTVGGNAQNYEEDGLAFYLGPLIGSDGSYGETKKIIDEVGVHVRHIIPTSQWVFNWTTGETWPLSVPSVPQFFEELDRYKSQWETEYEPFAHTAYTDIVPDHLIISTSEWFSNYPTLQLYVIPAMVDSGYGNPNETPALYMLAIFTPAFFTSAPWLVDYHEVFERWSKRLTKTTIHLRSQIESIDRSENNVTIHHSQGDGPLLETCSDVIMAFPPTTESLQYAGLELSPTESYVFSAVETNNYFSAVVKLDIPRAFTFQAASISPKLGPFGSGQPVFIGNIEWRSDLSNMYSWTTPGQSVDQVTGSWSQMLSKINKDPRQAGEKPAPVQPDDFRDVRRYPYYFPHFKAAALKEGMYKKYSDLQGRDRTYYTSGLGSTEDVDCVIRGARDLVQTHFTSD